MSFWKTILGIGAVAGVTLAALKVLEKLDEQRDEHWTAMDADFEGGISFPDMAERPNPCGGPIVYPAHPNNVTAEQAQEMDDTAFTADDAFADLPDGFDVQTEDAFTPRPEENPYLD